ncbi:two component, sigma54 specific, transcriptional regulator, Fis family [Thiorhodococcus drewsii AZ1]|uniref:Two component, sigma54 specific, transcriptional regulator, Fis family n=1 Tax=Thiorhodococcus drewsii AZ1 TaxID=765913 RepID=G2E617_9GAMM|nr:PEP-CTERM-box response regulator transcription factor [Thiorhodococcus drewsii]EGV28502.1 two component, sigma54 specific, transcriptional regulator, Fis family [Thiorhodococcus drewsii AZ1]
MSKKDKRLLVVEDDPGLQRQLKWCFDDFEVLVASNRQEAVAEVKRAQPSVVTLDLGLPPDPGGVTEGFAVLTEILRLSPSIKVVVVTGNDAREHAIRAVEQGAHDFYLKPIQSETLNLVAARAYDLYRLETESRQRRFKASIMPLPGIVASSPQMLKVCRAVEKVAPTDATVLLLGESGTGKELVARAIHEQSARSGGQLVAINCAAIPETLLESELFGHEKGAFTGATAQKRGRVEYACGGTLFLDEIGDLPFALQAKLLRFLQERVIERVGGCVSIEIDVRVICATHQNLQTRIAEGQFREDLYYRISEIAIDLPALREREGDALQLAHRFLETYCCAYGKPIKGLREDTRRAIEQYSWPGNVRELEGRMKRGVIMADDKLLSPEDLGLDAPVKDELPALRDVRDDAEAQLLLKALGRTGGNMAQTARLLGITRPTLYGLLDKHGLRGAAD